MNYDHIKLILGIKLKELRKDKGLSLSSLSDKTGISLSYLTEIEKGKKYPKADKISKIAEALECTYDDLVSLKVSNRLQPLANLLQSNFLSEIPFDFFGVDNSGLLNLMVEAPAKLSAFINAIITIGRNYNMSVENFHYAALRAYQEMHDNYFEEVENKAASFRMLLNHDISEDSLRLYLKNELGIEVKTFSQKEFPLFSNVRSIYNPNKREILLHEKISAVQRKYTLAKEIGFTILELEQRPLASHGVENRQFEEVLNSYLAGYFAGAIILPEKEFKTDIEKWLSSQNWEEETLKSWLLKYGCTPETLFYRLSNLLPKHFGIKSLFFMRFESESCSNVYHLTKELHLGPRLGPQEKKDEHYCRRWVSIEILSKLGFRQSIDKKDDMLSSAQKSLLNDNGNRYFVMSLARPLRIQSTKNVSVTLGFELDVETLSKVSYLSDPGIPEITVSQTCERCSIFDCQVRQSAPTVLQAQRQSKAVHKFIQSL